VCLCDEMPCHSMTRGAAAHLFAQVAAAVFGPSVRKLIPGLRPAAGVRAAYSIFVEFAGRCCPETACLYPQQGGWQGGWLRTFSSKTIESDGRRARTQRGSLELKKIFLCVN
jgi:hypothetical protein